MILRSTIQSPCGPGAYTLAEQESEKERKLHSKNTASSSKQYYFLEYLVSSFKEPADNNNKKGEKNGEATTVVVPGIRIASRTHWTTTNQLVAGPAAKGPDNEGQMRRSHVCFFGLVATCDFPGTCPTQKLPLFFNLIQMGPRKNKYRISGIPRRGSIQTSS